MICRNIKSKSFIIIWILIFSPLTGFAQIWGQDNGCNELIEELKSPPAINNGSNLSYLLKTAIGNTRKEQLKRQTLPTCGED